MAAYREKLGSLSSPVAETASGDQTKSGTYRGTGHHRAIALALPVRGLRAPSRHHRATPHVYLANMLSVDDLREDVDGGSRRVQPQVFPNVPIHSDPAAQQKGGRMDAAGTCNHYWCFENTLDSG